MNLQAQKEQLIAQFRDIDDIHLINAIQNLLDFASQKENNSGEISEAHQRLVMSRYEKVRKNTNRLLDWDEAKKTLKS